MATESNAKAIARYIWLSPFKVRRVAHHVRYRSVADALGILQHISHRSATFLSKVIRSASANLLQRDRSINEQDVVITQLLVDEGPRVKRLWHRGRGRADILLKRMCHITVYVDLRKNLIGQQKGASVVRPPIKRIKKNPRHTPALSQTTAASSTSPKNGDDSVVTKQASTPKSPPVTTRRSAAVNTTKKDANKKSATKNRQRKSD